MGGPQVKYKHRPVVSLEAEDDKERTTRLMDAAIAAGKRTWLAVQLYAGVTEKQAKAHLRAKGFEVKP